MKDNRRAGAARERAVRQHFRQRGWVAIKVSDSAVCDVVALKRTPEMGKPLVYLIEVKASARSAFADFPPSERAALTAAAAQAGATALLAHWPPGGQLRLIGVEEWPEAQLKEAA